MYKKSKPRTKNSNLSQFGLIDMPGSLDDGDDISGGSDDDMDFEAELAAITGGGGGRRKPKPKAAAIPAADLDAMVAASLKDIPSDEDVSDTEDDPDLLSELKELTVEDDEAPPPVAPPRASRPAPAPPSQHNSTVSLLQERISMYSLAEINAKTNGESSRARRFARGLKTLNDLLKQAKAGKPINDEDIPPVVSVGKSPASAPPAAEETTPQPEEVAPVSPPQPASPVPEDPAPESPPLDDERQRGLQIILKRKEEFKAAALEAKHAGDKNTALEFLKLVKQFDIVVDAYKSGQEMDLNELPTVEQMTATFKAQGKEEEQTQTSNPGY